MRVKLGVIITLLWMMICGPASAAPQNKINIQCNEIEAVQIIKSPLGMQMSESGECTSDCYFVFFMQSEEEAVQTNKRLQDLASTTVQIAVNDKVVFKNFEVSSSHPLPYSKYFSSDKTFNSYAEALQDAQQFCPDKISSTVATFDTLPGSKPANTDYQTAPPQLNSAFQEKAVKIIDDYVAHSRGWDDATYTIRLYSENYYENAGEAKFIVHSKADEIARAPGGGESFIIIFDVPAMKVKRELYFQ